MDPAGQALDRPDRAFVAALAVVGAGYAGLFGYYFPAVMIRRPYLDMFHYIMDNLDYSRAGGFLHYLWSQYLYSEHRQIWMRLLTAADVGLFHGVAYPFLVADTIAVLALPLLIGREIARADVPRALALTAVWATVTLTLTTANLADCSIPIEGIYPQTLFFVVLSLILFVGDEATGRTAAFCRLGAMLAAIGAGLASAVGLIIWPILAWAAWRGSSGWRWTVTVVAVGTVFIAFYCDGLVLFGLNPAITGDRQFYSSRHLLDAADALIAFLGLPWTRAPALAVVGRAVGAGFLIAGSFAVLHRGLQSRRRGRLDRIAVGLIMFSLATAGFAAVGRVGSQWQGIWPVRYALFVAPLHLGLLCLALPWLKNRWASRPRRRLIQAAALSFGTLMLVQQVAAGEAGARESQALNAAIAEFMATGREPAIRQVLWDNLAQTQHVVDEMRRRQLYLNVD